MAKSSSASRRILRQAARSADPGGLSRGFVHDVDFRAGAVDALDRLTGGITGVRPYADRGLLKRQALPLLSTSSPLDEVKRQQATMRRAATHQGIGFDLFRRANVQCAK